MSHSVVLYYLIVTVVVTEYLTGLVKNAEIFEKPRCYLKTLPKVGRFFTKLFECGYCLSVWVAQAVVGISLVFSLLPAVTDVYLLDVLILSIFTASFSNAWHGFRDRYLETYKDNRYTHIQYTQFDEQERIEENE